MKKISLQYFLALTGAVASVVLLSSLTGCKGDPDEVELDRVPNVPASTRGAEGASVEQPTRKAR